MSRGNTYSLPRDANRVPVVAGVSTADGTTTVPIEVDPVSGGVVVDKMPEVLANLQTINSLTPTKYDYISLSYTGANLTGVVFKLGGAGGTTVSTLTLAYDGSDNLISVTKT